MRIEIFNNLFKNKLHYFNYSIYRPTYVRNYYIMYQTLNILKIDKSLKL